MKIILKMSTNPEGSCQACNQSFERTYHLIKILKKTCDKYTVGTNFS